jgi:hypothetical protein
VAATLEPRHERSSRLGASFSDYFEEVSRKEVFKKLRNLFENLVGLWTLRLPTNRSGIRKIYFSDSLRDLQGGAFQILKLA